MTPEKIFGIVASVGVLIFILSRFATGRGRMGRAATMLGWGVLVACGIILAGLLLERFAK